MEEDLGYLLSQLLNPWAVPSMAIVRIYKLVARQKVRSQIYVNLILAEEHPDLQSDRFELRRSKYIVKLFKEKHLFIFCFYLALTILQPRSQSIL